jgi:hypothetical protein
MTLSNDQVSAIKNHITSSDITILTLQDDLVDHLCCVVEAKLASGKTFEVSFEEAIYELAPNGIYRIEEETILLLNPKILHMKKVMYSIGLVTTMSFTMGLMFKILHMPGGEELINYGFLAFALLFLPMVFFSKYRSIANRTLVERLRLLFGTLSAVGTGLAVLFKMGHLQGADILLMAGTAIFSFGFLPILFYNFYKQSVGVKEPSKVNL